MYKENLEVKEILVHEIFKRCDDKSIVEPKYSDSIEVLDQEALDEFTLRVTHVLKGQGQCLEMRIENSEVGSVFDLIRDVPTLTTAQFVDASKKITNNLKDAQKARNIPGGMVVIFRGTIGVDDNQCVGIIKAEIQSAFRRQEEGGRPVISFINDIFLTPHTRLYKLALFVQSKRNGTDSVDWIPFVYDALISKNDRESAATYFYDGFLGLTFKPDAAYETKKFFELTKNFFNITPMLPNEKRRINDGLYSFVFDEILPTFTVHDFTSRYVPNDLKDKYSKYMSNQKFTKNGVLRDLSAFTSREKRRRFRTQDGEFEVFISHEALNGKIEIKSIKANENSESSEHWTLITIKAPIAEK